MSLATERRESFYKRMKDELGLSRTEVIEILKSNGHDSFNTDNLTEYVAIVKGYMTLKLGIMDKLAQTPEKKPLDCPIPGCDGNRNHDRAWGWVCSISGLRHAIVWRSAEIMVGADALFEEVQEKAVWLLEQMEVLDEARNKEMAEAEEEQGTRSTTTLPEESEETLQVEPEP